MGSSIAPRFLKSGHWESLYTRLNKASSRYVNHGIQVLRVLSRINSQASDAYIEKLPSTQLDLRATEWKMTTVPLTELPHNHININRSRSSRSENASLRSDKRPAKASAPDPLQGMLKTTTEIGDVGSLALKPSRIHNPVRRDHLRCPDGSIRPVNHHGHSVRRRRSRYQEDPARRHGALPVSKGRIPSRSASTNGGDRSTPSPATSHTYNNFDHAYGNRSYSLTQSSQTSYGLSNHRSHVSLKNHGDFHLTRPRSPFAYPTRLKRPGFRPSSPAFSQYNGSDFRITTGLDRGPSFRTSSPSSLYARRRVPAGYTPDYNQSMPALPITSSHERSKHSGTRTPPLPRMANYVHPLGHDCPGPSVLGQNTLTADGQGSGAAASQPPRYYDYSEAFEEPGVCHPASFPEAFVPIVDQTIPEDRLLSVRYQLREPTAGEPGHTDMPTGDEFHLLEDHISSSGGPHALQAEDTNNEQRVIEPAPAFGVDGPTMDTNGIESSSEYLLGSSKGQTVDATHSRSGSFGTTVQQCSESPTIPRSRDVSSISTSSNGENLGISSSLISLYQFPAVPESSKDFEKTNRVGITEPFSFPVASSEAFHPQNWTIPSLDFSLMDLIGRPEEPRVGPTDHSVSLGRVADTDTPTIHAPVPRRSLSSQRKFDKILSVDEGLNEPADTLKLSEEAVERLNNSDSNIKPGFNASLSTHKRPSSRLSIRSLSRMMKLATVGEKDVTPEPDGSSASRKPLVSTTPSGGKLVKRSRHGTEFNAALGTGNAAAVDGVPLVHNVSRRSSGLRTLATTPTTDRPQVPTANAESLDPEQTRSPGRTANDESANEEPLPLPADTSFRSISPPTLIMPTNLPYSFVPLAQELAQASKVTPESAAPGTVNPTSLGQDDYAGSSTKYRVRIKADRNSAASLSGSQPWNFDESYPWTDRHPSIDVHMPAPLTRSQQRHEKPPKFKLKVSRASASHQEPSKVNQPTFFSKAEPHKRTGSPSTPCSSCHPTRKHRFGHFISSTRTSTSSDSLPAPSHLAIGTPTFRPDTPGTITNPSLLSPALHSAEVQSFFSDDSSQVQQKGSIRKRLSEFKAKLPASRGASTDEARALDRILTRSALHRSRTSARTVVPSEDGTAGISNLRYTRLKVVERIKGWWMQGAGKVMGLGGKRRGGGLQAHGGTMGVYAGV